MAHPDPSLSLYVHVPFCADKCLYCDFYSVPRHTVSEQIQEGIVERIIRQSVAYLHGLGLSSCIETIFMGGGTPSALPRRLLKRLFQEFSETGCSEWTVEANPESIDRSFLDLCAEARVTRLSVGVQSLHDRHLRLLRRPASRAATLEALGLLQKAWHGDLSLDFIAGIPGQSAAELREDLAVLDQSRPTHVSLYQLTCEPDTALAALVEQGAIALNPPQHDEELWFAGKEELERRGYRHYEISNFCVPGKECVHNLRYWRMEPYLGVGPGAVSTLPGSLVARALGRPDLASAPVVRISNPKSLVSEEPDIEVIEPGDFLLENLMMGLRLTEGIPAQALRSRFGMGFSGLLPGLWERWMRGALAEQPGERLRLTERGRMTLDALMRDVVDRLDGPHVARAMIRWP